jgi:transcription initiation factor TFIID subunit 6
MLPAILTCIVAKQLGTETNQDHFALRKFACVLLKHVIDKHGTAYQGLQGRITKTLLRALLDATKPVATMYGAMFALKTMGPQVIQLLVLPHIAALGQRIVDHDYEQNQANELFLQVCKENFELNDKKMEMKDQYGKYASMVS